MDRNSLGGREFPAPQDRFGRKVSKKTSVSVTPDFVYTADSAASSKDRDHSRRRATRRSRDYDELCRSRACTILTRITSNSVGTASAREVWKRFQDSPPAQSTRVARWNRQLAGRFALAPARVHRSMSEPQETD